MKIVSWNINSVRLRIHQVVDFLSTHKPDILCLQEIKCNDDQFPAKAIIDAGYGHHAIFGQKAYHGVAIVSRLPISKVFRHDFCGKGDSRYIGALIDNKIEVHNFYVPAGGDEPDPITNEKFDHKLKFMTEMAEWTGKLKKQKSMHRVLVGDLNVAPEPDDVWSHKQMLKVVSHTPIEVNHLNEIIMAGAWNDAARTLIPAPEKLFSWWSYRSKDWRASNRGRRLDHIWTSPSLEASLAKNGPKAFTVHDDMRSVEKPSDHAPISLKLSL